MKTNLVENLESSEIRKAIELAEESAYSKEELESYERYWDQVRVEKALISDAIEKGYGIGKEEGKIEGKIEMIVSGFSEGISISILAKMAKLTEPEVEQILKNKGKI